MPGLPIAFMTTITHRAGSLVGLDQFPAPTDFAESPLSKALKQPLEPVHNLLINRTKNAR